MRIWRVSLLTSDGQVGPDSVRVLDLANRRMRIFSGFSKGDGVERTVEELSWAIQTYSEENPQVGVMGQQVENFFKVGGKDQLINHYELKLRELIGKIKDNDPEEDGSESGDKEQAPEQPGQEGGAGGGQEDSGQWSRLEGPGEDEAIR